MDFQIFQPSPWHYLMSFPPLYAHHSRDNHVHWTQTPESHIFSAHLPGMRREEIKVEVEDATYLIIRTEAVDESRQPSKSFIRKFRLPGSIDVEGISAVYEDGVLTVTVPRAYTRRGFFIDPGDVPERLQLLARAA